MDACKYKHLYEEEEEHVNINETHHSICIAVKW